MYRIWRFVCYQDRGMHTPATWWSPASRYNYGLLPPNYPVPSTGHAVIENCMNLIFVSYVSYGLDVEFGAYLYETLCWADNEGGPERGSSI